LFFANYYQYLREELDESYKIKGKNFEIDKIKTIRIDARTRGFLKIMKALTEGPCTARQITMKYHNPSLKKRFRDFQNTYHRTIIGNDEFPGLIKKQLVEPIDPDWKSKRNNQFRLTLFGVLYSIRLFCEPILSPVYVPQIRTRDHQSEMIPKDNSVIYSLIDNYQDSSPLIFGKWNIFNSRLKFLFNILIFIAHYAPRPTDFQDYPFFDSSSLGIKEWKRESNSNQDEFALLFLGYLYLGMNQIQRKFHSVLSKDNEIYSFYEKHLSLLEKVEKIKQLKIKIVHDNLTRNFSKTPKRNKRILDIKGRPSNSEITKHILKNVKALSKKS